MVKTKNQMGKTGRNTCHRAARQATSAAHQASSKCLASAEALGKRLPVLGSVFADSDLCLCDLQCSERHHAAEVTAEHVALLILHFPNCIHISRETARLLGQCVDVAVDSLQPLCPRCAVSALHEMLALCHSAART